MAVAEGEGVRGIKGTMSVVELNMLKIRMQAGMEAEARRGELLRVLPTGYGYDKAGKLVKDPDLRVQQAIELAFRVFRETGSIRKTFLWFRRERIELPVNRMGGGCVGDMAAAEALNAGLAVWQSLLRGGRTSGAGTRWNVSWWTAGSASDREAHGGRRNARYLSGGTMKAILTGKVTNGFGPTGVFA